MMKVAAPDFLLLDLNGHSVGARDFDGQPRVIVFWATWCKPCHAEMEALKDANLPARILAIATDPSAEEIRRFVAERGYRYPVLLSDHKVDLTYEVEALPKVFVIDAGGYIRAMRQGSDRDFVKHLAADLDGIKPKP
jgi:peroxiredoxin